MASYSTATRSQMAYPVSIVHVCSCSTISPMRHNTIVEGSRAPPTPSFSNRTYNDSRASKIPPSVLQITIDIGRY